VSRYLARAIAAFVAVVLAVLIVPIALLSTRLARTELRERADREATVVAAALTATGIERPDAAAARLTEDQHVRTIVLDANGDLVADTAPSQPVPPLPPMTAIVAGAPLSATSAGAVRAAAPIVGGGGEVVGAAVVVISPTLVLERTRVVGLVLAGVGVVIVATAAGFGSLLARSLVRPVEQLDAQALALATGELTARVAVPARPPELHRLATSFNDMARRLDAVVTAQRTFTSDAAHQLRTPLTVLRLRLESLEDRAPDDVDVVAATREVGRLQRLIDDLLTLTRLERGTDTPTTIVSLASVVREHCETWSALIEDHGVTLRTRCPRDGLHIRALPGADEQVLDNYLENALRVAPAGSAIDLSLVHRDGWAEVRVADRGPGLDDQDRAQAFDRFWSGSQSTADGGTGLGLAIVARLVTASGGHARLDPRTGGGIVAVAAFPTERSVSADPARS
jgi:two-component system OmpR family sensor kinase